MACDWWNWFGRILGSLHFCTWRTWDPIHMTHTHTHTHTHTIVEVLYVYMCAWICNKIMSSCCPSSGISSSWKLLLLWRWWNQFLLSSIKNNWSHVDPSHTAAVAYHLWMPTTAVVPDPLHISPMPFVLPR
jgi:hypothetical protein